MTDTSKAFKRRDLLKKAGAVSAASVLGTIVAEAAPKIAEGEVPINLGYGGGGHGIRANIKRRKSGLPENFQPHPMFVDLNALLSTKGAKCTTPMPNGKPTPVDGTAIIQTKQPPSKFCQEQFPHYTVVAWYEIVDPSIEGEDEGGRMHRYPGQDQRAGQDGNGNPQWSVQPNPIANQGPLYIVLLMLKPDASTSK